MNKFVSIYGRLVFVILLCSAGTFAQHQPQMTLPKILSMPIPEYAQAFRDAAVGGDVFVLILIDKKGKAVVKDSYGPNAPCSNLDDPLAAGVRAAAVAAAQKAIFEPATWKGKPVEKGYSLKYHFDPQASQPTGETGSGSRSGTIINGRAINIPKPKYPGKAQGSTSGIVNINVVIFEDGHVHLAGVVAGPEVFRRSALEAACLATFTPTLLDGIPVRSTGIISYVFYNTFEGAD